MDFGFRGFETKDADIELEEVEVAKVKKFDRCIRAKSGGSINCTPTIQEGTLYFGACDHYFYAVDAKTGKEKWRFKANGMFLANFPVICNDVIFVCCSDGHLYALSLTGKEIWRFRTDGPMFGSKPSIANDRIYFGSYDGYVRCIDAGTGKDIWKFRTGGEISSSPAFHEGKIFIGSYDGNFYCLESRTGKEIWRFKTGAEIMNEQYSMVYKGRVYFSSFDNYLYAVNINTGEEAWRFRTGNFGNSAGPEIMNGMLIHASRDGILYAINPENGKEIWSFRAGMGIFSGVLIHDGKIYFGCEDGNVYVLNSEGKELWRFKTGGPVYHYPAIWDNRIYFGSWDCHLYAVDMRTHKEVWRFATSDSSLAYLPPSREMFEVRIKKETRIEDTITEDRYKSKKKMETVSISDYRISSEYSTTSEYKQKSDYDVSFVMFEGVLEGEDLWISDLKVLSPVSRTST